jgi:hypothetical protein
VGEAEVESERKIIIVYFIFGENGSLFFIVGYSYATPLRTAGAVHNWQLIHYSTLPQKWPNFGLFKINSA